MKIVKISKWYLAAIFILNASALQAQQANGNSNQDDPAGIVGGSPAAVQNYPWMASILMSNGDGGCGATLIKPNWVLTAAHCAIAFPNAPTIDKVVINSLIQDVNSLEPFSELIDVDSIIPHQGFNFLGGPDLALLHLSTASSITPVTLAEYSDSVNYAGDMPAKVLGWGVTVSAGNMVDSLRVADCIFISDDTCATLYSGSSSSVYGSNPGGQICAGFFSGTNPAGAGTGDSGGPLFFEDASGGYKQVGIVSGGDSDVTTEDFPGVYTLIPKHRAWIDDIIANYGVSLQISKIEKQGIEIAYLANHKVQINGLIENADYDITLVDISGKIVFKAYHILGGNKFDINLNHYASGVYIVTLQNNSIGTIMTKKIMMM